MKKRILTLFLAAVMAVCMLSMSAFANTSKTYLALGDSISAGYGLATENEAFPSLLAQQLGEGYTLVNQATNSGETTATLLAKLQQNTFSGVIETADVITITIGGNDLMGSLYAFLAEKLNMPVDAVKEALETSNQEVLKQAATVINQNDFVPAFGDINKNFASIISSIKAKNPNAAIIVATQYNPYEYLASQITSFSAFIPDEYKELANAIIKLSTNMETALAIWNQAIKNGAQGGYVVADVYTAFKGTKTPLCNAGLQIMPSISINLDFHPNKAGHEVIAACMKAVVHNHAWATTWSSNASAHWHTCVNNGCSITDYSSVSESGYQIHSASTDDGNCLTALECPTCKFVFKEAQTAHSFTNRASAQLISVADCQKKALYKVQCDNCDAISDTMTVEAGEFGNHSWDSEWSHDENSHWHKCLITNCTGQNEKAVHYSTGDNVATYFKKAKCDACGREYGDVVLDNIAPTGKIEVDGNIWDTFVNGVEVNLYFKESQTVKITVSDEGLGVDRAEYYYSNIVYGTAEDALKNIVNWNALTLDGDGKAEFDMFAEGVSVIYLKITDKAGNVTVLRSNGIGFDNISPVIAGIENGKTYCEAVEVKVSDSYLHTVKLNGTDVSLTNNKFIVNPADGEQTIVATDKADNSTSITITVKNGHVCDYIAEGENSIREVCQNGDHEAAVSLYVSNASYTGSNNPAEVVYSGTLAGGNNLTISYTEQGQPVTDTAAAGEYVASITLGDKTVSAAFTVERAIVTEPVIHGSVYTGSTQTAVVDAASSLYTVDVNAGGIDAGEYDVVLKLTDNKNYKWLSTDEDTVTLKFIITKADNEWKTSPSILGWTYGETGNDPVGEAKFGTVEFTYYDSEKNVLSAVPVNAGNYFIKASVTGNDNYEGISSEYIAFTIEKVKVDIPIADATVFIYTGQNQTYTIAENPLYLVEGTTRKEAGSQQVKVELIDSANCVWSDGSSNAKIFIFTIGKAPLTVTAKDNEIVYGDIPAGNGAIYTGLVNGETDKVLDGTLDYDFSYARYGDIGAAYTIMPKGLESDNYEFIYVEGNLTVLPLEAVIEWSVLTADDLVYDGKAKILTATVKNKVNGDAVEITLALHGENVFVTVDGFYYEATGLIGSKAMNYSLPAETKSPVYLITKATPAVDFPVGLVIDTVINGRAAKLSDIDLTGFDGFVWDDAETEVAYGTHTYAMTFTPDDMVNYTSVTVDVFVTGRDVIPPTGTVSIGTDSWNQFWNNVTFGLFFKDTQSITITASDTESGVKEIAYYLADAEMTVQEIRALDHDAWKVYKDSFTVNANNQYVIYVKITDNVGNISYINSDGIVLDNIAPVISGIENGKDIYGDAIFTVDEANFDSVTVDGAVADIKDGKYRIPADNAKHTIIVTDKSGNKTQYTLTIYKVYTVTYIADGKNISIQKIGYGKDAVAPQIPVKDGYTAKWSADGKNITADTTIVAQYTEIPQTEAPETSAPETSAPETEAPESSAPETSAPETSAPETSAPETSAPETSAPEINSPETGDSSNILLWIVILILSVGCLAGVVAYNIIKRTNK